jgi:hypothetical protein
MRQQARNQRAQVWHKFAVPGIPQFVQLRRCMSRPWPIASAE